MTAFRAARLADKQTTPAYRPILAKRSNACELPNASVLNEIRNQPMPTGTRIMAMNLALSGLIVIDVWSTQHPSIGPRT